MVIDLNSNATFPHSLASLMVQIWLNIVSKHEIHEVNSH